MASNPFDVRPALLIYSYLGRKASLVDLRWTLVKRDSANASVEEDKKCEFHGSLSVWNLVLCGYPYVFTAADRASSKNSGSDHAN